MNEMKTEHACEENAMTVCVYVYESVSIDDPSCAFIPQDQTELGLALIPALPKTYGSVFADLGQRWIKHTYTNGHTHTQK